MGRSKGPPQMAGAEAYGLSAGERDDAKQSRAGLYQQDVDRPGSPTGRLPGGYPATPFVARSPPRLVLRAIRAHSDPRPRHASSAPRAQDTLARA